MSATEVEAESGGISSRVGAAISIPALGAILFWSGVSPFGKYAMDQMPAMVYIALRPVLAAVLVFVVMTLLRKSMRIDRADFPRFSLLGLG